MILGILIGMYMGLYNTSIALFFCIEIIIIFFGIKFKNMKFLILFLIILLSFCYSKFIANKFDFAFTNQQNTYLARVISLKEETKYYNRYTLQIESGKYKNYKILAYTKENLNYGNIIKFSEKIEQPEKARNDKRF